MRQSLKIALVGLISIGAIVASGSVALAACSSATFCGYNGTSYATKLYEISGNAGSVGSAPVKVDS